MERLRQLLLGHFTGVDQLHASAWSDAQTAAVEMTSTPELDGALIIMRIREERPAGSFAAVNVLAEDRDTGEVLLYGFDSFGYRPEPPARGRFEGDELTLLRSTERGQSRLAFVRTPSGFSWGKRFRASSDHPWQDVVTGDLNRVPSPSSPDAAVRDQKAFDL